MRDPAEPASPSVLNLRVVLLDYFKAPGKYQLTLRQPAVLFESVREILQIAAGRTAPAGAAPAEAATLHEAATFFIRAALLYPGADHYAVLGLPSGAEPVELKERYRLMMRLAHPDFASGAAASWSTDAAVRVNRAYEVLSSPVLRREYDEQLAGVRTGRAAEGAKPAEAARLLAPAPRREQRTWQLNPAAAWMLALGAGALGICMLLPGPETAHLVQRTMPPAKLQPAPAAQPRETETAIDTAALIPADALGASAGPPAPVALAAPPEAASALPPVMAPVPAAVAIAPRAAPPSPLPAAVDPNAAEPAAAHRRGIAQAPARQAVEAVPAAAHRAQEPAVAASRPQEPSVAADAAPAVVRAPVPAMPTAVAPPAPRATTVAAATPAGPSLADAQPLLTQLLHLMESGSGDQLLRLLESDARQAPSAQALSRQYEQIVRGGRPVRLSHVEFQGESRDGLLLVTGRIRLHAGEPTMGAPGERLLVRAEFQSRGGKVLLTGLGGASD